MRSNFTHQVSREGYDNRRRMQSGRETPVPIINWRALWTRIWMTLKRWVAELWFLLSRRKPMQRPSVGGFKVPHSRYSKWAWPAFKVAAALVLFMYFLQRDIQFSIHMKAPVGAQTASIWDAPRAAAEQMGLVQPVALSTSTEAKAPTALGAQAIENYIERFGPVARAEMSKYGIPASIKMAQALLESQAGLTVAAKVDNNHFGSPLAAGQPYESAWRNWREHSLLLLHRFSELQQYDDDYRAWARGLQELGYSKNSNYANELLELIDRFHLEQLDDSTI